MADEIIIPVPEPESEPAAPEQNVVVNIVPESEPAPAVVPEQLAVLQAEIAALAEKVGQLEGVQERLLILEAENEALEDWLDEWEDEAAVVEAPVVDDVPPIPEAPPKTTKPDSANGQSWDFFRNRKGG